MDFKLVHTNFNVFDLDKSLDFYKNALGLHEVRRHEHPDGDFIIVFMADDSRLAELELTWLRDRTQPYDLGDQEFHICYRASDYAAAYEKHKAMGVIIYENTQMGLYFIGDPDGYWIEITPEK